MPPENDAIVHSASPATEPVAATLPAPALDYAPAVKGRAVRRWLAGHPALLVTVAIGVALIF